MSQGFGHPPQWSQQLPRMNDLLASTKPTAIAGTVSPLLPPPSKVPGAQHHVGSQTLAQYRSPWATERIPQGLRQDGSYLQKPVTHPLSGQAHERDRITHEAAPGPRDSHAPYTYSHIPIKGQGPCPPPATYPPFGPAPNFAVTRDSGLQLTHSPRDQRLPGDAPHNSPVDQSGQSEVTTEAVTESPWGFTKAGKARKRLEQACVSCRKKKTKCEPMNSGSKCLPCEKSGSRCHFDNT